MNDSKTTIQSEGYTQVIEQRAEPSKQELLYLLTQFWAFRRLMSQAVNLRGTLHSEDKVLFACALEAIHRDIISGLCRLEDPCSQNGLRSIMEKPTKVGIPQSLADSVNIAIKNFNDNLKQESLKTEHRNKYIAHLNLASDVAVAETLMEGTLKSLLKEALAILDLIKCCPEAVLQVAGSDIKVGLDDSATLPKW